LQRERAPGISSAMSIARSPVIAFVATTDAARARAFYEGALGLAITEDSPFALVANAGGTMLRIQKVEKFTPLPFTTLGWQVSNIEKTMKELTGKGVRFERYDFLEQDAEGVWSTPDGAKIAWFKDPDGNTLSVAQMGSTTRAT
jgi:catechol 2,3-dioxygenase-like lactoylglutathione lyase family enzyme